MARKVALSNLVYTGLVVCLLTSLTVLGCSPQVRPSPTVTPTQTSIPTATVTPKPTTTLTSTDTPTGQPQYGGTLKVSQSQEATSLGYPAQAASSMITVLEAGPAAETLLRFDTVGNTVPWLATASTANVGAKTITLTLRKGVKFQDGTDFNASAVKWNIDQLVAAKSSSTQLVASVDVVDDYTVRVNLTAWDSTVIGNFAQAAGLMLSPAVFQTNGVDWAVKHPIGTGPFKFVSWQSTSSISYNKFDGYWQQGRPYLDSVQVVIIVDDVTRELSLRAGEIQAAFSLMSTNYAKLKADGFSLVMRPPGSGIQGLVPDSANPKSPFADVRVRQAAAYAIDNVTLARSVYGELGATAVNQLTYPGYWAYNPSVVGYPYDPAKAKQLLTAAGYPNGFQTRIQAPQGGISQQLTYATGVQSYLKAVGIDATMDALPQSVLNQLGLTGRTWEGLGFARFPANPDWVSIMSTFYNGNGSYVNMLVPDDYSQAIKNAIGAPDFATKQKFAQQAMQLAIDKYALMVPEYSSNDSVTSWPYVHATGLYGAIVGWTPENAWLAKK